MTREARREALLARFRVGALERLAGLRARVAAPPLNDDDLAALKAGLHTLKGETRMLGLSSLASSVHAIEDWLGEAAPVQGPEPSARLHASLELLRERLEAPLIQDADAELALARARAILSEPLPEPSPSPAASASPSQTPSPSHRAGAGLALVDAKTLDQVCDRLEQLRASLGSLGAHGLERSERDERVIALAELDQLRHECGELTELAWSLRMVVVEPALRELAAHAERLASKLGKQVRVEVDAGGAELERSLLERLHEPLMHLIHNSIDHGIEAPNERGDKPARARLTITARSLGRELELEVGDDGRGIDRERVRVRAVERGLIDPAAARGLGDEELLSLLFVSGFSTASRVSELSGRGVGLDVVRRVVEGLGGNVELRSEAGRATRFLLRVPASISRERIMVVGLGHGLWGLPARRVGPIVALRGRVVEDGGSPMMVLDGEHVPLLSLAGLLGITEPPLETIAICCTRGTRRYALASPAVLGEYELFRLPLGPTLTSVGPASASAVMDDGQLVLLLEPAALLDARRRGEARFVERRVNQTRARVLVVDDSAIVRELLVELLLSSSLEVESADDGQAAIERLAEAHFDLVVTDLEMPRLDGFGLLTKIRERHGSLPVIMSSTRAAPADRQRAVALGADAYIVKSEFTEQSLLEAVARFVDIVR